jgi:alpha-methylacyl-CoA racemase
MPEVVLMSAQPVTSMPLPEGGVPKGPLAGIRVLDLSALGPGPFCSMVLADFGAEIINVRRPTSANPDPAVFLRRGKRELVVDLRDPDGAEVIARMAEQCDVFLESNRPGVMERRGLGPDALRRRNPRLVYTRLTGWGQTGPYSGLAGHDINYLAVSGALGVIGDTHPVPPLALLGDIAGGSMMAAFGTALALFERERTGAGQIVDASIVDGAVLMLSAVFGELASGMWKGGLGTHILSGIAPFYTVYECADHRWFSVGAIEAKFYQAMLRVLEVDDLADSQWNEPEWPERRRRFGEVFAQRDRDEWTKRFAAVDACGAPVLDIEELDSNEHLTARRSVLRQGRRLYGGVTPRLSEHPDLGRTEPGPMDPRQVLADLGFAIAEVDRLMDQGVVANSQR